MPIRSVAGPTATGSALADAWDMDGVNGKIVEIRRTSAGKTTGRMAADHAWSGLKPSRARAVDAGGRPDQQQHAGSSSLRGTEWAPSWATTPNASDESRMSPWSGAAPGHGPPTSLPGSAPARWKRQAPDVGRGSGAGHGTPGLQQQPHRQGWKRSLTESPRWGTDRRYYRFDSSPCSETKLDAEMTMFESQITRTVSDHLSNLSGLTSSLSQEISSPLQDSSTPVAVASTEKSSSQGTRSHPLKKKRSGLSEGDDVQPGDCGWIHPLKLIVRKGLTLSDVGDLGRIIIPKKDAESQSFPQLDTKEGTVLEMEDYTASKRWYFRFKYWINNKSRMYVLENTGQFIKYHSLKEHDIFIVYEDGFKNLVVCGQKKSSTDNLDPSLDLSKDSASETPPTSATEDESSSRTTINDNIVAAISGYGTMYCRDRQNSNGKG